MDEDAEREQPPEPLWRRCLPQLSVSFPRFVALKNPRLGIFYWLLVIWVCIVTLFYFMQNSSTILVERIPVMHSDICSPECGITPSQIDSRMARESVSCARPAEFALRQNETTYDGISCAKRCGNRDVAAGSCVLASELMHLPPDQSEIFFPSFYQEATRVPMPSTGGCPSGFDAQGGLCNRHGNFFVPGAEFSRLVMHHGFEVLPPSDLVFVFGMSSMIHKSMARSSSPFSVGWSNGMKTLVFDAEGVITKSFDPGDPIDLSVLEILEYTRFEIFNGNRLRMDTRYTNPLSGVYPNELEGGEDAAVRLTGLETSMSMHYTDKGSCYHHPTKQLISIDHRPVCCIVFDSVRTFTRRTEEQPFGVDGGSRTRTYHGMRVTFSKTGWVGYLDMAKVSENFTVFIIWIQLPLFFIYWLCVLCLGGLSDVYSHVIHQRFNLPEACKGLAARLLSHSAAFMDLRNTPMGISKDRLFDRCLRILEHHRAIDESEVECFSDFVFTGIKDLAETEEDKKSDAIKINEYCSACISDEPISMSQLADLFDADRVVKGLERLFQDQAIKEVIDSQKAEREMAPVPSTGLRPRLSQMESAIEELVGISKQVSDLDGVTAAALSECEELLGSDFNSVDPFAISGLGSRDQPKDDQNESKCSIADEEDAGKDL